MRLLYTGTLYICIVFAFMTEGVAQENLSFRLNRFAMRERGLSSTYMSSDIEYTSLYHLLATNPSFGTVYGDSVSLFHPFAYAGETITLPRGMARVSYSMADREGDFLFYEGTNDKTWCGSVHQQIALGESGTLALGFRYLRSQRNGIRWTSLINTEDYYPYLFANMTKADTRHSDNYSFHGAYSLPLGKVNLGVAVDFDGTNVFEKTDPRLKANEGDINASLGLIGLALQHLWGVSIGVGRTTQFVKQLDYDQLGGFSSGTHYGLGQWTLRTSQLKYSRRYIANTLSSAFHLKRLNHSLGDWTYYFGLSHSYRHMYTEEDKEGLMVAMDNLAEYFHLYTHTGQVVAEVQGSLWQKIQFSLAFIADLEKRYGQEVIYAFPEVVNDQPAQHYYEVNRRNRYSDMRQKLVGSLKIGYPIASHHFVALYAGVENDYYEELFHIHPPKGVVTRYPDMERVPLSEEMIRSSRMIVFNDNLIYHAGVEYRGCLGKWRSQCNLTYHDRGPVGNIYNVPHTIYDYQFAFSPYAFRSRFERGFSLRYQGEIAFKNSLSIGLLAEYRLQWGKRVSDVIYGYEPPVLYPDYETPLRKNEITEAEVRAKESIIHPNPEQHNRYQSLQLSCYLNF